MSELIDWGATLSDCARYRYRLWRAWGTGTRALFVMLNPSTADGSSDDPTVRKCCGFARRWGMDGVEIVNVMAYRATDPRTLAHVDAPVGPLNRRFIEQALENVCGNAEGTTPVIVAWGSSVPRPVRHYADNTLHWIRNAGVAPLCLGKTKHGYPRHPSRLAYDTPAELFVGHAGGAS